MVTERVGVASSSEGCAAELGTVTLSGSSPAMTPPTSIPCRKVHDGYTVLLLH